ncbi:MAG: methyltransferase domain-containing protein [Methanophagales archaeon]|nr:methyltransferase domain-containing protein [Methanophagales archaeon]
MVRFAFELSKEHETLPKAEVLACLNALGIQFREEIADFGFLLLDLKIKEAEAMKISACLASRLGMTHRIYIVLGAGESLREIAEVAKKAPIEAFFDGEKSFAVRVRRLSARAFASSSSYIEREIGDILRRRGLKVDLNEPFRTFVVLLTGRIAFFSVLTHSVDKKQFQSRKPSLRPFSRPISIQPKLARVVVNLSEVRAGEVLLDPFCGTGGILMEASAIGARAVGVDIQQEMAKGACKNIEFYGLNAEFIVGNAQELPIRDESVDAIATDFPYGRSSFVSSTQDPKQRNSSTATATNCPPNLRRLWSSALEEMNRVLKPGRKAVVVSHAPLFPLLRSAEMNAVECHKYRVHKSLSRYITVLRKA